LRGWNAVPGEGQDRGEEKRVAGQILDQRRLPGKLQIGIAAREQGLRSDQVEGVIVEVAGIIGSARGEIQRRQQGQQAQGGES
jgi:hypothetical protein